MLENCTLLTEKWALFFIISVCACVCVCTKCTHNFINYCEKAENMMENIRQRRGKQAGIKKKKKKENELDKNCGRFFFFFLMQKRKLIEMFPLWFLFCVCAGWSVNGSWIPVECALVSGYIFALIVRHVVVIR